jgi:hypothetical protein
VRNHKLSTIAEFRLTGTAVRAALAFLLQRVEIKADGEVGSDDLLAISGRLWIVLEADFCAFLNSVIRWHDFVESTHQPPRRERLHSAHHGLQIAGTGDLASQACRSVGRALGLRSR